MKETFKSKVQYKDRLHFFQILRPLRPGLRIRIKSGQWIRIRNPDLDPDQEGKNDPQK
jgi:hypothetical protein